MDIFLLLRTLKHLKLRQVLGQIRNRLPRTVPAKCFSPAPIRKLKYEWKKGINKHRGYLGENRFRFLNIECELKDASGWWGSDNSYLWYYNLNYFEWLNQEYFPEGSDWICRWIVDNPPSNKNRAWEPYPVSVRIINWVRYFIEQGAVESAHESLYYQTQWLMGRIETHLLGNHYFVNGVALLFAGFYFEGKHADRWVKKGWNIVRKELPTEILDDGGHFERSVMYHSLILEDVLNLLNAAKVYEERAPDELFPLCRQVAENMLSWLQVMTYPDGSIPLFNDAANGIASSRDALQAYACRLDISLPNPIKDQLITRLKYSGFARIETEDALILAEIGGPGPKHQPGHSHAGTLGFEFAILGNRLLVDAGTNTYEVCKERLVQRSTKSHNTLSINGRNSSEVWSSFRVGRRATGKFNFVSNKGDSSAVLSASHNGYQLLGVAGLHQRVWKLRKGALDLTDSITQFKRADPVEIRFHFAPNIKLEEDKDIWIARCLDVKVYIPKQIGFTYKAQTYEYCPEFGVAVNAQRLIATSLSQAIHVTHVFKWL